MKPKIAAAMEFVRATGRPCGIGDLHDALDVVRGKVGTWIVAKHEHSGRVRILGLGLLP